MVANAVRLHHAGVNTVALTSCPAGILVPPSGGISQPSTELWLQGGPGGPEAVLVTSTTCPLQGNSPGGNITFAAVNTHNAGYTLGSASSGIQEAINAANFTPSSTTGVQNGFVVIPPGEYPVYARVTILGNRQYVQGSGAILNCQMADACLFIGDYNDSNFTSDVTVDGLSFRPGGAGDTFTMIEDNGQHSTIRNIRGQNPASAGPRFNSMIQVDNDQSTVIDALDANSYPTSAGTSWASCAPSGTYTSCSNIVQGANNGPNASVIFIKNSVLDAECYANGVDLGTGGGGSGATGTVVFNGSQVTGVNLTTKGTGYTSAFPVTFSWQNPNNIFPPRATGFAAVSGGQVMSVVVTRGGSYTSAPTVGFGGGFANTLKITDSIVQAYPQFGIRYRATYPNLGLVLDNVYQEVGGCTNPQFNNLQSQAGVIALGSEVRNTNGAAGVGTFPQFYSCTAMHCTNTVFNTYWVIGHSSTYGNTVPLRWAPALPTVPSTRGPSIGRRCANWEAAAPLPTTCCALPQPCLAT